MLNQRNAQSMVCGRGGARKGAGRKPGVAQPERLKFGEGGTKVARVPAAWDVQAVATALDEVGVLVEEYEDLLQVSAAACGGEVTSPRLLVVERLVSELRAVLAASGLGGG